MCSNCLKISLKKTKGLFELREQISRGDFKTIRGVRIIRVFELIGNLLYISGLPSYLELCIFSHIADYTETGLIQSTLVISTYLK